MRLDKFLAHHLDASRSDVTKLLKSGRVTVDGILVKQGATQLSDRSRVTFDDRFVEPQLENRYFLLNKPQGYVCSHEETHYPAAYSLLDEFRPELLHYAGRLDVDTTGLVLLTDDGLWSHRITSPRSKCEKKYKVTVSCPLSEQAIAIFKNGIQLKGEKELTQPAKLELLDEFTAYVTLREGKYHQVKRMFAAIQNQVIALHRISIGILDLDLEEGQYRSLTKAEITAFL